MRCLTCYLWYISRRCSDRARALQEKGNFFISLLRRELLFQSERLAKLFTCCKSKQYEVNVAWDAEAGTEISKLTLPVEPEFLIPSAPLRATAAGLAEGGPCRREHSSWHRSPSCSLLWLTCSIVYILVPLSWPSILPHSFLFVLN